MSPEEVTAVNAELGTSIQTVVAIKPSPTVYQPKATTSATILTTYIAASNRSSQINLATVNHQNEPSDALADLDSIIPALNIDIPDIDFVPSKQSTINKRGIYKGETDAMMRARLVQSLSFSFPGSALSNALKFGSNQQCSDRLSSSCFAELRMDKIKLEEFDSDDDESIALLRANNALSGCLPEKGASNSRTWIDITSTQKDDDLTPLAWLQDSDLLKNFNGEPIRLDISRQEPSHPTNIPYNPQKHIKSKPPYSFSCLIFMAIEDFPLKRLPVKDIYNWMLRQFPYFVNAPTGWKNSVRHNLSLNKCFRKVDKDKGSSIGKGSLWMIDPDYRPNLLQALRKTPYHPFHQLQMMSSNNPLQPPTSVINKNDKNSGQDSLNNNNCSQSNNNKLSPDLFPFLSKRLNQDKSSRDSHEDLDVANTLVEMKNTRSSRTTSRHSPKKRSRSMSPPEFGSEQDIGRTRLKVPTFDRENQVVPTTAPSDDHTYGTMEVDDGESDSQTSSVDEEYDFGETCVRGSKSLKDIAKIAARTETPQKSFADSEETEEEEEDDDEEDDDDDEDEVLKSPKKTLPQKSVEQNSVLGGRRIRRPKRFYDDISPPPSRRSKMATKRAKTKIKIKVPSKNTRRQRKQKNPRMAIQEVTNEEEKRLIAEGADALLNLAGICST